MTDTDYSKLFPSTVEDNSDSTAYDWLSSFALSGLESIPELVGITPSTTTLHWRQDNPVSGIVSELAGMAVPYTGWLKATKAVAGFDKAVRAIGNLEKAPFLTGAAQEIARFAPFEIGRVAASQVVGDQPFGDMLGSAALNLAIGGGIGGLASSIASAGIREPKLTSIFPGLDLSLPLTLQLRKAKESLSGFQGEDLIKAQGAAARLAKAVREEELGSKIEKYIAPLAYEGKGTKGLAQQLERLFKSGRGGTDSVLVRKRFTQSSRDFGEDWINEARQAGLKEGFEDAGQYFRHVSFKPSINSEEELLDAFRKYNIGAESYDELSATLRGLSVNSRASNVAKRIDSTLTSTMTDVGDGWFLTREADDGMFILARKYNGTPGQGAITDKWVLLKTDTPGTFIKEADRWTKVQTKAEAWLPTAKLADNGGFVYNVARRFGEEFPFRNYSALIKTGRIGELIKAGLPKVGKKDNELVSRMGEVIREYLAPTAHQFKKSARANYINAFAKAAYDAAETEAQKLLYGTAKLTEGRTLFFNSLSNESTGSYGLSPIKQLIDSLKDEEIPQLWKLWRRQFSVDRLNELVASGDISPQVAAVAREIDRVDNFAWENLNLAEKATGHKPTKRLAGHYGLSRQWEGDTRIVLRDNAGNPMALAAGPNRKAAQKAAKDLITENPDWRLAEEFSLSQSSIIPKDVLPIVRSPSFVLEREGLRGFKWDTKPFTRDELMDAYAGAVRNRTKYQANLTANDMMSGHMQRLAIEDTAAYRMVTARLNDYAGIRSPFAQWQNKVVDQVLAPILGTNSADAIVRATNTTLWHLQLGAMNLRYPVVNALTFLQTVLPEAVYMLGAPPERLAGRYSYFAAGGQRGPASGLAILSPLKLMRDSLVEMRKPGEELLGAFSRAVNERVIDPRMVEEFVGESAVNVGNLREALKSSGGFAKWIKALSEFLPANSERLARGHAFTTGYIIGRDHLGLKDEALYSLAKQFTENTMYLYGGADRPRAFTTPAGSTFGLFKNWMFNYLATMAEYTGEATRGNWGPLLWQTAGTAAVGGLAATPLYAVGDIFSRQFSDKGIMQQMYENFGQAADGIMYGLPAQLLGLSLYSSVASPVANPQRDADMLWSIVVWDRMKHLSQGIGQAIDHWQATGEHPGKDQRFREFMAKSFAPASLYRILGAMEDETIKSLASGYPVIKNVSGGERILYALGFNPTELERSMAVANELFMKREAHTAAVKSLGSAWYEAYQEGNGDKMALVLREAMIKGIDASSVIKSGMQRIQKSGEAVLERNFKPADVLQYRKVLEPGG